MCKFNVQLKSKKINHDISIFGFTNEKSIDNFYQIPLEH